MDKQGKYTEDRLSHYINPERIEKAPEGFTNKVMSLIEKEEAPVKVSIIFKRRTLVPYVFSGFIIVLVSVALFLPGAESKTLSIPALEVIRSIKINLPEFDLGSLLSINIPSVMLYGLSGILLLSFLDKALYGVFHKQK
jgi:hypothetical protein